jgi:hypothetical protein
MSTNEAPINLSVEVGKLGVADELPPHDRARLSLAKWILLALVFLMILSWLLMIFGPCDRLPETREIFNFVKTVVPPLITLVIGFYFNSQRD